MTACVLYNTMMIDVIRFLLSEAFGCKQPFRLSRRQQRKLMQQRMRMQHFLSQLIVFIVALVLFIATVHAQESQPKFRFDQPSDEMDFTLPPVPDLPGSNGAPAPLSDAPAPPPSGLYGFGSEASAPDPDNQEDGYIDQFFSTTTIIAPDAPEDTFTSDDIANEDVSDGAIEQENIEPQPIIARQPARPRSTHRFKSVRLPKTIYHRPYSRDNKHLPFAYMQQDQQALLEHAIIHDNVDMLRSLFNNQANIQHVTKDGEPALILAVRHHAVDATRWLLLHGANPNVTDQRGFTPLHYAAHGNHYSMTHLLMHFGADKTITDAHGNLPSAYAELHNPASVASLLQ